MLFIFTVAAEAIVPDLVGRTRSDATQLLASLGLQPKFTGMSRASIVNKQKPDAGTRVKHNTEIELAMISKDR